MNVDERLVKVLSAKPFGIEVSQTWLQIGLVFELIQEFHIGTFVELGLFRGGLADLLIRRMETVADIAYFGFENNPSSIEPRVREKPCIHLADVFEEGTVAQVAGLIRGKGDAVPAFIYCDDGDKPREMLTYSPILKPGDYLMAHDYPGEITPASLYHFSVERPYMAEVEAEIYRNLGVSLWRRTP